MPYDTISAIRRLVIFGEAAINDWFRQRLHPEDAESQTSD